MHRNGLLAFWTLILGIVPVLAQTGVTTTGGSANTIPVFNSSATISNSVISQTGGNIGIGTQTPGQKLYVVGDIISNSDNSGSNIASGLALSGASARTSLPSNDVNSYIIDTVENQYTYPFNGTGNLVLQPRTSVARDIVFATGSGTPSLRMVIQSGGNIGIGTTSPSVALEINGNVKLTSGSGGSMTFADGTRQATAWTGVLCGGDYSEAVETNGKRNQYEPGDVLVISGDLSVDVEKSSESYSTSVAGIYATKPGVVGKRESLAKASDDIPMAMVGIVPTKASAENGPIHRGDLLVTSSRPGFAMKGTDRSRMLGAVIGKAMGPLDSGTGIIEVLVTLQ